MSDWREDPGVRLTPEQRAAARAAVRHWARTRGPREPVLCFLDGSIVRAWALAAALGRGHVVSNVYRRLRPRRAERIELHVLSMFAVEMERTSPEALLLDLYGAGPGMAGPLNERS
ncbi:MAG: hypothetical protein QOF60_1915 [Actinomycetota bacterium]|nr:hypothetical protein [Actinomycetota bacterium]